MGTGALPAGKAAGAWRRPPHPLDPTLRLGQSRAIPLLPPPPTRSLMAHYRRDFKFAQNTCTN
jgi:hypothetical protein